MNLTGPTLRHFILRQQVISLYRHAIRASKGIPDPVTRRQTVHWFRSELERNRDLADVFLIDANLKMARRDIKRILPSLSD